MVDRGAFFGSAVGALFFGDLADRIGRPACVLVEPDGVRGLALLSAVVTQVWMLFVIRVLIGVAIGADIAASIAFLAELSPKGSRGGWTGAMPQIAWSLGAMCAVLVDAGLYASMGRRRGGWRSRRVRCRRSRSCCCVVRCRTRRGGCSRVGESRTRPPRSSSSGCGSWIARACRRRPRRQSSRRAVRGPGCEVGLSRTRGCSRERHGRRWCSRS